MMKSDIVIKVGFFIFAIGLSILLFNIISLLLFNSFFGFEICSKVIMTCSLIGVMLIFLGTYLDEEDVIFLINAIILSLIHI